MAARSRPEGVSSRIRPTEGDRHPWLHGEVTIDLPVIVDWVSNGPNGEERVRVEARVDLADGEPVIVEMSLKSAKGLDPVALQRDFRWASPLDVVTGILPGLIAAGVDPYSADIPVTGFPAAAVPSIRSRGVLSDDFLTTIAREYLVRGRGYAASLAADYFVTPRTVVSWVEKARARGILSPPPARGATGGHLLAKPRTGGG